MDAVPKSDTEVIIPYTGEVGDTGLTLVDSGSDDNVPIPEHKPIVKPKHISFSRSSALVFILSSTGYPN